MTAIQEKVAFITGGLGGIGFAIVKELLQNGAKGVAIVDFSENTASTILKEIEDTFGHNKAVFIKADVTQKTELEGAFEKTVQIFKQLDIVVNNAGIVNEVDWEKTIAVNLTAVIQGSYLAMEKYLPKYKSSHEGIIVNIASILGLHTIQPVPAYCISKHGVVSLGEALGGEEYYKKYKVRVLTICPGVINTPLISQDYSKKVVFHKKLFEKLDTLNELVQEPEVVGKTCIKVINDGKSGSLWVTEEGKPPYEVEVPHWKNMRKN